MRVAIIDNSMNREVRDGHSVNAARYEKTTKAFHIESPQNAEPDVQIKILNLPLTIEQPEYGKTAADKPKPVRWLFSVMSRLLTNPSFFENRHSENTSDMLDKTAADDRGHSEVQWVDPVDAQKRMEELERIERFKCSGL